MKRSPFKVSGRIVPPYFIGRDVEIEQLVEAIRGMGQDVVVIAPRRFGKTALLHNVTRELGGEVLVAAINCLAMTRYADLNERVINAILVAYEDAHGPKGRFLATWKSVLRDSVTGAFKNIIKVGGSIAKLGSVYLEFRDPRGEINPENEHKLAEAALDFAVDFSEEQGVDLVLIFDEFQALSEFDGVIFNILKEKMDASDRVRYVFSGSSISMLRDVFLSKNAPLYQMTARYFLDAIEKDAMTDFIKSRFEECNLDITDEALDAFWDYTRGIPFYFQKLGLVCYSMMNLLDKRRVELDIVNEGFREMMEEFNLEFEERLSRVYSEQQQAILKAMGETRYNRMKNVAERLRTASSNISRNMMILSSSMTIMKSDDGSYYITDEVFRRWIGEYILTAED